MKELAEYHQTDFGCKIYRLMDGIAAQRCHGGVRA